MCSCSAIALTVHATQIHLEASSPLVLAALLASKRAAIPSVEIVLMELLLQPAPQVKESFKKLLAAMVHILMALDTF
jgi:hypothetical protein